MTDEDRGRIITSYEKIDELHKEKQFVPTVHLWTSIPTLDEYTGGCKGGQLVIVSGDEGEGKSTILRTLTHNFSNQNARCLWFSYEERPDEFLAKFGESVPYFLLPAELEMSTISWLHGRIKAAQEKYGVISAVFIDHLHYLTDEIDNGNLANDLGRICRKLKLIAVADNIIIVLVCHTNRSEAQDEPNIRSLRDSGMIGKEANKVWFIFRHDNSDTATIKVAKDRETGVKNKKLYIQKTGPFMVEYIQPEYHQMHSEKIKNRGRKEE